jgi:hypothetical protein
MVFTGLHLFANYKAVTSVRMETLNQARLHLIVRHYLENNEVLDVKTVNKMEPVLFRKIIFIFFVCLLIFINS